MKIKKIMKYFKEGVLKYFKISMNFLKIFQSEIFHRASLISVETLGSMNSAAFSFLSQFGWKISAISVS